MAQLVEISIEKLYIGETNVRRSVGDITELTRSIEEKGVYQPILVRPMKGRYEIVVGSRRFEAAKAAGLKTVPAVVNEMSDEEAITASLTENIQRGNLEPEEEAEAMIRLVKAYGSNRQVAKILGISERSLRRKLSVLELIPKLRKEMRLKAAPPLEERRKSEALPFEHATMIAGAFRTEEVKRLPKAEREAKQMEIARVVAPLTQYEARKIVDRFKMFPEKTIDVVKEEALASETGVAIRIYLTPKIARLLSKAADDRGMSMEELVPIAVEEWLKQVGYRVMG